MKFLYNYNGKNPDSFIKIPDEVRALS